MSDWLLHACITSQVRVRGESDRAGLHAGTKSRKITKTEFRQLSSSMLSLVFILYSGDAGDGFSTERSPLIRGFTGFTLFCPFFSNRRNHRKQKIKWKEIRATDKAEKENLPAAKCLFVLRLQWPLVFELKEIVVRSSFALSVVAPSPSALDEYLRFYLVKWLSMARITLRFIVCIPVDRQRPIQYVHPSYIRTTRQR